MSLSELSIEYRSIAEIIPYVRNSRTHSDEQVGQIAASIKEFGFTNPVLIDDDDLIIAGHGRVMAASRLKMDQIPCIKLKGLTDTQRRAYVIADNKLALNAGWDTEMLQLELQDLEKGNFNLELLGFSADELEALLKPPVDLSNEGLTDPDEIPEEIETRSKTGDLWILGRHKLLVGDSTLVDNHLKLFGDELADLVWTDPPYNVAYEGKTKDALTIQNDSMSDGNFKQFLYDAFLATYTVTKPGGAFYIAHADSEGINFRSAAAEAGWMIKQCLIWVKNTLVMGRQDYQWKHEPILYGWKPGASHQWYSDRKQTTVIEFNKPSRNDIHPTMKPVDLIEYMLKNSSKQGDIVFDPFGGSGSTLMACEKSGRSGRTIELDPKYCDAILQRWENFTGLKAVLYDES